jgi:hypothetical protein
MAAGRLSPFSKYPLTSGLVYPKIWDPGAGAGVRQMEGLGVAASLASDATWALFWALPASLPSGQCKLELMFRTSATTGNTKVNPKWDSVAYTENPAAETLSAEGVVTTAAAGTANVMTQIKINLDALSPVASHMLIMHLVFETASWTLAAESVWVPWLIWE